ncbi:hypothetical protein ASC97_12525 [Rhizobium sp. Root1203]|uniref:hypothetical protein n=1 Tax=Rhizobium sp. Root1203 TaxID=1736427 RepID=UPI00070D0546|nr:hypothetical protein [Rhizobium sp. Root1203]KQV14023.1 hypothetical protein ASC97_12525 [Rhizobium sp. Root1203]
MKTDLVPQDVYMKHENEWQALRQSAESRIEVGRAKRSDDFHFNAAALRPESRQSGLADWKPIISSDASQKRQTA